MAELLASKVCAWVLAPPDKLAQRDTVLRMCENADAVSLQHLLSTGALAGGRPLATSLQDLVHPDRGETLLHRLFVSSASRPMETIAALCELLVQRGLSLRTRDLLGRTPLHTLVLSAWADTLGLCQLVQKLLQLGADPAATDAGGVTACALLRLKANANLRRLQAAPEEDRGRYEALHKEQLAATLLLVKSSAGAGGLGSPVGGLGSPVKAHPGIFLYRTQALHAVLLVADSPSAEQRIALKLQSVPAGECQDKSMALEACFDPRGGYKVACALGPFLGAQAPATASALLTAWRQTVREAAPARAGCVAKCHCYVAAESEEQQLEASGGECCPHPQECEFSALAAAHALCKPVAPKRYKGAAGAEKKAAADQWAAWHRRAQAALPQEEAGPAGAPQLLLTALGTLLLRHGRRDWPAQAPPRVEAGELATAGLPAEQREVYVGMGSPSRSCPRALGGGGADVLVDLVKKLAFE